MRVTIRTSPARRKSRTVFSSSRPCVVVPLRFSARITLQPAARYPMMLMSFPLGLDLVPSYKDYIHIRDNGVLP